MHVLALSPVAFGRVVRAGSLGQWSKVARGWMASYKEGTVFRSGPCSMLLASDVPQMSHHQADSMEPRWEGSMQKMPLARGPPLGRSVQGPQRGGPARVPGKPESQLPQHLEDLWPTLSAALPSKLGSFLQRSGLTEHPAVGPGLGWRTRLHSEPFSKGAVFGVESDDTLRGQLAAILLKGSTPTPVERESQPSSSFLK